MNNVDYHNDKDGDAQNPLDNVSVLHYNRQEQEEVDGFASMVVQEVKVATYGSESRIFHLYLLHQKDEN